VFGGKDAHQLLAEMNVPDRCNGDVEHDRLIGIELEFGDEIIKYPIKIVENTKLGYNDVKASEGCEYQGYFYDDEDDDDWEDDY